MRRYIETINVGDRALAYKIMTDLEKDGEYLVEYREENDPRRCERGCFEIRVYKEENLSTQPVGFSGESVKESDEQ